MRKALLAVFVVLLVCLWMIPTGASSHREAPLISADPLADNTDVYAFVSPTRPGNVVLISNYIPFQYPSGGPNYYRFDPNVLYEIMVDNNGDAVEDVTFQFRFANQLRNPNTFLYNTGQVTSLDDPDLNFLEYYSVTRVEGPRRTGNATLLSGRIQAMPANVGLNSMPDYASMIGSGVNVLPDGSRVFAGQRDEGFYVDLGATFDLLQLRNLTGKFGPPVDSTAGYNVSTVAIEVPVERLTRNSSRPTGPDDPNAVIGVWSTASRPMTRTLTAGGETQSGPFVQVSRLGQPLVNEVVIPRGTKDVFNGLEPTGDGAALQFVTNPEVPQLIQALFGVGTPPAPRNDLVTIFLTGIPGLNQPPNVVPSEMLRLNTGIPPTPDALRSPLGLLGGDLAGFPNGRRVGDDVVDVALRAMAGGTPLTPQFNVAPNNALGDGVDRNDVPYLADFPFLAVPHPGLEAGGPSLK